jgi:hypothetical protein
LAFQPAFISSTASSADRPRHGAPALWADSPDFAAAVNADDLPQSFRLELAEPSGYRRFAARFQGRAGVSQVIGRACQGTHK